MKEQYQFELELDNFRIYEKDKAGNFKEDKNRELIEIKMTTPIIYQEFLDVMDNHTGILCSELSQIWNAINELKEKK